MIDHSGVTAFVMAQMHSVATTSVRTKNIDAGDTIPILLLSGDRIPRVIRPVPLEFLVMSPGLLPPPCEFGEDDSEGS